MESDMRADCLGLAIHNNLDDKHRQTMLQELNTRCGCAASAPTRQGGPA